MTVQTESTCLQEVSTTYTVNIICPEPPLVFDYTDDELPIVNYTVQSPEQTFSSEILNNAQICDPTTQYSMQTDPIGGPIVFDQTSREFTYFTDDLDDTLNDAPFYQDYVVIISVSQQNSPFIASNMMKLRVWHPCYLRETNAITVVPSDFTNTFEYVIGEEELVVDIS